MSMFDITGAESCKRCGENARAEVERLQDENEKLRKLVTDMCACFRIGAERDGISEQWCYELFHSYMGKLRELAADVTDKIIPLWEYVADVAKQLNDDAFANMEGADGDVFQLMDELASCAYSLKKIAEKLKRIEDKREKR